MDLYIYQLGNNRMLVYSDGNFSVKEVGYPLPDCKMPLNGVAISGQDNILKAILSYQIANKLAFMSEVSKFEPMSFDNFKYKIIADNIGGGCPLRLRSIGRYIVYKNMTEKQAFFVTSVPNPKDDIILPSDEFLLDNIKYVYMDWVFKYNTANKKFRSNILMYKGIKDITDDLIDYLVFAVKSCMNEKFSKMTIITSPKNISCVIFSSNLKNNDDIEYFYSQITNVNISDGYIDINMNGNNIDISFTCEDEYSMYKYENTPIFHGTYSRRFL